MAIVSCKNLIKLTEYQNRINVNKNIRHTRSEGSVTDLPNVQVKTLEWQYCTEKRMSLLFHEYTYIAYFNALKQLNNPFQKYFQHCIVYGT